ncbi:unnamed protein product [Brassica oleracea]
MVAKLVEQENGVELVREKLDVANNCLDKEGINVELERSKEVVEAGVMNLDGERMELGEVPENWEEADAILELVDEFQNLTDGEDKEVSKDDASGDLEESLVLVADKRFGAEEGLLESTGFVMGWQATRYRNNITYFTYVIGRD